MPKPKINLVKTEKGYDVEDEKWNTLGDLRFEGRRWVFYQGLEGLEADRLEEILRLMRGLEK